MLAAAVLAPTVALAHAHLISPPPRSTVAQKTGPCGDDARTVTPTILAAGQMLEVDWVETVDHPGYFRILFSAANDADFTVLKDDIPNPPGAAPTDFSTMVKLPATACQSCTLQLIQVMTDNPTNPRYFSCADIRLVGGSTPTTTTTDTTGPKRPSTTSTTTPPEDDPCAALGGFEGVECVLDRALARPMCGGQVDPALEDALAAGLAKARTLVERAAARTRRRQVKRLLHAADGRLLVLRSRVARSPAVDGGCAGTIEQRLADLHARLLGLRRAH